MPEIVSFLLAVAFVTIVIFVVQRKCNRVPALGSRRGTLLLCVMLWTSVTAYQAYFWSHTHLSYDGFQHDTEARVIAGELMRGEFPTDPATVFGNKGYRLTIGVFYALTQASPAGVLSLNALFGFLGLLLTLEAICVTADAKQLPSWAVYMTFGLPSAFVWIPLNLKEGMVVFGIGTLLNAFARWHRGQRFLDLVVPNVAGFCCLFFFRPHICFAWIMALAFGATMQGKNASRSILILILFVPIAAGTMYGFYLVNPGLTEDLTASGTSSLDAFRETRGNMGNTATGGGGGAFNVLSGIVIVLFSSLTHASSGLIWLIMGIEGTVCTAIGFYYVVWRWKLPSARKFAIFIGCLCAMVLLGFFLGFMYNMGLAVRQRLQVVPAILVVAILPALLAKSTVDSATSAHA